MHLTREDLEFGVRVRHVKSGHKYFIYAIAKHTETEEEMVVYYRLTDDGDEEYWVRPLTMFLTPGRFEKV